MLVDGIELIDYTNVPQFDHVIVLGGGLSAAEYADKIYQYKRDNDAVVLATSRKYSVSAEYTVYADHKQYIKYINSIESPNIIVYPYIVRENVITKDHEKKFHFLLVNHIEKDMWIYKLDKIQLKDSTFQHGLGNCGITCLLLSIYFRPKSILVVGMDGFKDNNFSRCEKVDGIVRHKGNKQKKLIQKQNFIRSPKIWSFLQEHGVEIRSIKDVPIWGLDKVFLNIKEI